MDDILNRAIEFAVKVHSGMTRKDTDTPYILHPMEAGAICGTMTTDREVIAAALLHDVVEDTPTTIEDVEELFGKRVAHIVAGCSEDKREEIPAENTWKIRKQETIEHLSSIDDIDIEMVALSDKLSNLRSVYRDLVTIGDDLWNRFNEKDPKEHAWYYASIARALSDDLRDTFAWQEYHALVEATFGRYFENGIVA